MIDPLPTLITEAQRLADADGHPRYIVWFKDGRLKRSVAEVPPVALGYWAVQRGQDPAYVGAGGYGVRSPRFGVWCCNDCPSGHLPGWRDVCPKCGAEKGAEFK